MFSSNLPGSSWPEGYSRALNSSAWLSALHLHSSLLCLQGQPHGSHWLQNGCSALPDGLSTLRAYLLWKVFTTTSHVQGVPSNVKHEVSKHRVGQVPKVYSRARYWYYLDITDQKGNWGLFCFLFLNRMFHLLLQWFSVLIVFPPLISNCVQHSESGLGSSPLFFSCMLVVAENGVPSPPPN